jgi:hypothetical protein
MTDQENKEVKPGWTVSHIVLTVVLSLLTGIVGYSLKYIFEQPPKKTITVLEEGTDNLLKIDKSISGEVITVYKSAGIPDKPIKGYWKYKTTLTNSGDVGVDNFRVVVETTGKQAAFSKTPNITTSPTAIIKGLKLTQNNLTPPGKDEWLVDLLNPGESVSFEYFAYSPQIDDSVTFTTVVRKKDWEILSGKNETPPRRKFFLDKSISDFDGKDIIILLGLFFGAQLGVIIYFYLFFEIALLRQSVERSVDRLRRLVHYNS